MTMEHTQASALVADAPLAAQGFTRGPASAHAEKGRTHGLSLIFWALEQGRPTLLGIPTLFASLVVLLAGGGVATFVLAWLAVPLCTIVLPVLWIVFRSHLHDAGTGAWEPYVAWRDP